VRTADFDYALPPELIAQHPAARRDESRLLVLDRGADGPSERPPADAAAGVRHLRFREFPSLLEPGDVVIVNDSRVIPARLVARRTGGGAAEVLLLSREEKGEWRALVRPGARIRPGASLTLGEGDRVEVTSRLGAGERLVRLVGEGGDLAIIARHGRVPLPPYIAREPTEEDAERYQTVFARRPGSIAAPTAGLHFTDEILDQVRARGAGVFRLTLHIGPGTFRPVTAADPSRHRLDEEAFDIPEETARAIAEAHAARRQVWAVGTTCVRALESVAGEAGSVKSGPGGTSLLILPGHIFRVVTRLLTNFHLPRSTLLMLVCAFAGRERVLAAYHEAIRERYRFYSYGDAMAVL
jgi:S-adenosylmethionine:tRNA ribosyltransferase-isomerase